MNEFSTIAHLGILIARPATLIAAAPVFGGQFAPPHVRIGLAVLLAILIAPMVPPLALASTLGLGVLVAREMAIGLIMALALRAIVAGAELGGHLTGNQLMLSYGSVIDPQGGVRNNLIATIYGNLTLLTFLAINGHHALLRALVASYSALPIGSGGVGPSLAATVTQLLGIVFVLGLRLAAPLIVVMLLLEVGMALMARVAPSLNLMAVAPPIRVVIGLLGVAAMIPLVPSIAARVSAGIAQLALQGAAAFR
ncbi:MAG TPA: flagellar biosynthetic protein FliR [Vicinamibacterales bacterium]|nr:flagellar biosynthetic protein FliR [Vicinamibacterales bacterium]